MKTMELRKMELITAGKSSFWKCAATVAGGMISGGGSGFMIGSGFLPGFGSAFGAAVGLYLGGLGAGLSSSSCTGQ